ncbi:unnamed protein product [Closterium sp. NIES-65]|nr:unnamed protein product [Closterium sp. NIES-65]
MEELRKHGGAVSDESSVTPIQYWGGPVLSGNTLNVYLIYYDFWPKQSAQTVIENFIRSLSVGGAVAQGEAADPKVSNWWAINSKYYSQASDGSAPTVSTESKIGSGKPFLYDANGIYLLLTSTNIKASGFCTEYCGYHTMDRLGSKSIVYSLVGHHGLCRGNCGAKQTSPNGKPWLDAMVSTIAHEIAEAATDPNASSGWFDANGEENADKCSYEYGETQTGQNVYGDDAEYNLVGLNGMKFMVERNWDVATDSCVSQTTELGMR